jgi:hypothetical protein
MQNLKETAEQELLERVEKWRKDREQEADGDTMKLREIENVYQVLLAAVKGGYEAASQLFESQSRPMKGFKIKD